MAGRKDGADTIRERKDGRWKVELLSVTMITEKLRHQVYSKLPKLNVQKMKELQSESYHITGRLPTQVKSSMMLGAWIDLWYQNYCKQTVRESTRTGYENRIYST